MLHAIKQYLKAHPALRLLCTPALLLLRGVRLRRERALSQTYDRFFNLVTGTVVVRCIPELDASFEIDCRSHLVKQVLTGGCYEPEVTDLIRRHVDPDKDAIDVGANVGIFTVLMSSLLSASNKVLAIEPTPAAVSLLKQNLTRNGKRASVIVFEGAATQESGTFTINVIPGMEEYSSLGKISHRAVENRTSGDFKITGEPLDVLVKRFNLRPGFIKLDTEGAEFQVLNGAVNTIETHRPVIVSEILDSMLTEQGANSRMVIDFLRAHRYSVVKCTFPEILAIPEEQLKLRPRCYGRECDHQEHDA